MESNNSGNQGSDVITLVSSDDQEFPVPRKIAEMSNAVKNSIEFAPAGTTTIPVRMVNSSTLAKVIEFCQHYDQAPMEVIEKVCRFFFKVHQRQ